MTIKLSDGMEVIACIMCEDARPEQNGKWTLLGVFAGSVAVPHVPANFRLAEYIEINVLKPYTGPLYLRLLHNGAQVIKVDGSFSAVVGVAGIAFPSVMASFAAPGKLTVELGVDDRTWVSVLSKDLVLAQFKDGLVLPTASPPLS